MVESSPTSLVPGQLHLDFFPPPPAHTVTQHKTVLLVETADKGKDALRQTPLRAFNCDCACK